MILMITENDADDNSEKIRRDFDGGYYCYY